MSRWFGRFATAASAAAGHPVVFALALALVLGWAAAGPWFGWSDSHSLFINTATTICTYLLAFLIQHSQNADTQALQKKLDEVIKALPGASDEVAGCERKDDS